MQDGGDAVNAAIGEEAGTMGIGGGSVEFGHQGIPPIWLGSRGGCVEVSHLGVPQVPAVVADETSENTLRITQIIEQMAAMQNQQSGVGVGPHPAAGGGDAAVVLNMPNPNEAVELIEGAKRRVTAWSKETTNRFLAVSGRLQSFTKERIQEMLA